ncbi:bifunctional cytochrome P450/NADPH--P450 reductase [Aspergillus clavatus NRRL 1]|uniref:Bifunctional cytochrome P450/NADPH--P450 reductase n=1 Tax=Aspergillus clavatus (strain ATCC 1007 / CBS 513.65 / DSM 816 / NCTC 3887 / NRRL 1 / QM 1276 / 107) TaxID=344612 RepID=A1CK35_ASPCL|nr:fatty acid hydroxylase, putative [Aspergillus clavatus NRRL 1]EAW09509.1 fatty acid hydroxylase, putative [Aspergillus clavatus NRRL 1]
MTESKTIPIPGPKGVPLLGNIYDIEQEVPLRSINMMADHYGEIYRLTTFGRSRVFLNTHELVNEACDEERFSKVVTAGLNEIRNGIHDGLFTAHFPGEENWAIAHRVLVPAFGPLSIRGMYDDMYDIATQLVMKWARQGPHVPIMVTDDFTRLTLDTIALCAMGTRFNSFYHEEMHPFVEAMVGLLQGSGDRARRPALLNNLPTSENAKYWSDIEFLRKLAQELVDNRRQNPEDKKDLLNSLILGRDPKSGQGLSDSSIIDNMITFLIAGHETTSGLLSFLFYYLLKNPRAYQKAQEEVDAVIGRRKITVEDLSKLPYINAVMRETLRLRSTAPLIALHAHPEKNKEDPVTLGNGKYVLNKDEAIVIVLDKLHRDPKVYGPDAEEFRPERMLDEEFDKLPKNAWKPFGNGMRACIGRPFAWQEALLVVAILLQNFNFQMDDPSYDLHIKQTLTIKPKDFHMRAALRHGLDATQLGIMLSGSVDSVPPESAGAASRSRKPQAAAPPSGQLKPMHIFFGSNTGTCETFARRLADDAVGYGFAAEVQSLDSAKENIPKEDPVVFITASYEGQPPDNAAHFFEWLSGLKGKELEGINYAVFGCGHHDWHATFHRIPKAVNELVGERGGNRLCDLGLADAAHSDMFTDFDSWGESAFWPAITSKFGGGKSETGTKATSNLQVEISSGMRASTLGLQLQEGFVIENQLLSQPGVPAKRMVKFKLPSDMTYQCGDYLAVLPVNPSSVVRRAIRRFDLPWDAMLTIRKSSQASKGSTSIPLDTPVSAFDLLSTYVELSQPASKRDLNVLADAAAADADVQAELRYLASSPSRFTEEIVKKRLSPLDILIRYPSIKLPVGDFLAMLPPMRVRQYSISSSPLADPSECCITFSVLNAPSLAAASLPPQEQEEAEQYLGVASTYLSELKPGDRAHISVRPSHSGFKPPMDLKTPMIMACAGSGLAPFRGFVMDRAEKIRGRHSSIGSDKEIPETAKPAKAILYVGCRTKGKDDIHAAEFAEWAQLGAVEVRWAYSRPEDGSKGRHVQDLMLEDRAELVDLFDQGARIYVCGSTGVGNGVRQACKEMYLERRRQVRQEKRERGEDVAEDDEDAAAEQFLDNLKTKERYATDVFT